MSEEYTGPARPWPCRYCHAGPDEPCHHAAGWRLKHPHGSRRKPPRRWGKTIPIPDDVQPRRSISAFPANMNRRLLVTDHCWHWQGAVTSSGYGSVMHEGRPWSTHRLAYELLIGPIPDGLLIDHLCLNKLCCNPKHLEPVTAKQNVNRHHIAKFGCASGPNTKDPTYVPLRHFEADVDTSVVSADTLTSSIPTMTSVKVVRREGFDPPTR